MIAVLMRFGVRAALMCCALGGALGCVAPAFADPAPQVLVRARLEPAGPVVAGSEVKLVIDLLTTTWFTEAPNWPLFTVPDAIVSLPDEQADNLSEEINGVHWFGVSRAYRIAPQAGKTFDIAPFRITVYPGGTNAPMQVMTPALKLVTTLPPGAQGMATFFPAPKLTVTQKIDPSSGHLRVGDSITRTITQSAAGTESMLIPPVGMGDVQGLKRYPKPPATRNIVQDRVGLVAGERIDSVTYIADHSGRFKLPPLTIEWWNTKTQKKETVVLPGATFSAAAAHEKPLFEIPAQAINQGLPHRIIVIHGRQVLIGAAIAIALMVLIGMRARLASFVRRTRERVRAARASYEGSELKAWRALGAIASRGDWRATIPALYRWMDRSREFGRPARLDKLARNGDAAAQQLVAAVSTHYAQGAETEVRWQEASAVLQRVRRKTQRSLRDKPPLPPLNRY